MALVLALLMLAATAPDLVTLDLPVGGSGASSPTGHVAPETTAPPAAPANWTTDPLAPPVEMLGGR